MKKALRLLLNLHPGEERRAFLFLILGLIWGTGCYGSLALGEGLFLENAGTSHLPSIYLGSSTILCALSSLILYNLFKKRVSPKTLFLLPITTIILCNFYCLCYLSIHKEISQTLLIVYRMLSWSLLILVYTNFWSFVDQFFNIQDAKRHFSIFNAIIFLGDAIGAGIVNKIKYIGIETILLLFISILLFCYPLVYYVSKSLKELSEDHDLFVDTGHPPSLLEAFKLCIKDNYTFYLLGFYFLMQLLTIAIEFNYLKIFEQHFSNKNAFELTAYITKCSSWISLANMCFSLFIYSRIIKNIGINNMILIAPLCFTSLFFCLSIQTTVGLATIGMVAREGITYALDDNNLQLLIYGIPNKIRNQLRIAVECFIEPIGMFVFAVLCFITPINFKAWLLISIIALVLCCLLRSCYAKAILRNLSAQTIQLKKNMSEWVKSMTSQEKRQVERNLLTHLKNQQEKHQLFAFQYLLNLGSRSILPSLLAHMNKLSPTGKLRAIEMLKNSPWATDFLILELLNRWLITTPHPSIARGIHLYFAEHRLLNVSDIVDDIHEEPGDRLLAAILTIRYREKTGHYRDIADARLHELLCSSNTKSVLTALSVLRLEKNPDNFPLLVEFLENASFEAFTPACEALLASVKFVHKPYCKKLIHFLKYNAHRKEACNYLIKTISIILDVSLLKEFLITVSLLKSASRKYAESVIADLPKEMASALLQIITDSNMHHRCRILATKALCKIDNKLLRKNAYRVIKTNAHKAMFYDYHRNFIQRAYPQYNLSLLVNTLESNYHAEINFMLEFLGILGSLEHSDILIRALTGKNKKARAQALESLEKNCDAYLFAVLDPFINAKKRSEKYYLKYGVTPLKLKELFNMIENTPSYLGKLTSKQLKEELALCDAEFQPAPPYSTLDEGIDKHSSDDLQPLVPFFTI